MNVSPTMKQIKFDQGRIQRFLLERIETARMKNPRLSIRSFSRKIGISAPTLSLILRGRRSVSRKMVEQMADRLLLDPHERGRLFSTSSSQPAEETEARPSTPPYAQMTMDQYAIVAEWQAYAILNLMNTHDFRSDIDWIAQRLGCTRDRVIKTLSRLKRLEMLVEDADGNLRRVKGSFRTSDDVANLSLRKSHHQTLELAQASLENDAVENRDFSWVTAAIDTKKLPVAKALIRRFMDDLFDLIDQDAKPDEVYRLAIQFFPLTQVSTEPKGHES